ncbi:MAG: preprotein translocase subunit SecA [Epulopiscium sp. Nele67-Bin002]|nr:MAG: preprotein translocase subunit SecA [Epulopiscium sp. Nuni2H_MBin001]OON92093.1 MAG: preprotein translocase subunit SecA [Epulopiscium sp. Nele67-Bin002]
MTLYDQWENYGEEAKARSTEEYKKVVEKYLTKERNVYAKILSAPQVVIAGKIGELAKQHDMTDAEFLGFVDGINESLIQGPYNLHEMDANSEVKLEFDIKKLYWNMLDAKADWLYKLAQWDTLLSKEEKAEIEKEYNKSKTIVKNVKVGRNAPCICGSGKKFKKCCIDKEAAH